MRQALTTAANTRLSLCLDTLSIDSNQNKAKNAEQLSDINQQSFTFFSTIIKAQLQGKSALPYQLGLTTKHYKSLLTALNDLEIKTLDQQWHCTTNTQQQQKSTLMTHLLAMRLEERDSLTALLTQHQARQSLLTHCAAIMVATACLNPLHLWQSLGFAKRADLGLWLALNFPKLTASNTKGMRWKRFFYLKLCEQGGDYVCRAPSCEECSSFAECFSAEE